jgi:hypothetical protein
VSDIKGGIYTVFGNMVLRKIFGPKRDDVEGGWRKVHNEELRKLCFSQSIIRMIKSKRISVASWI